MSKYFHKAPATASKTTQTSSMPESRLGVGHPSFNSRGDQAMAGQVFGLDRNNDLPHDQSNYLAADPGTIARGTAFYQSALGVATSPASQNSLPSQSDTAGTTKPIQAATATPEPSVSSKKLSTPQPPKAATTAGDNGGKNEPTKGTRAPRISYVDMRPMEDKDIPYMFPLKRRPGRPLKTDTTAPSFQSRVRLANTQRDLRSNVNGKNNSKGSGKAKAKASTTNPSDQNACQPSTTHAIDFEYRPTKHRQLPAQSEPTTPIAGDTSGSGAPTQLMTPTTTPDRGRGEKNLKRLYSERSVPDSPCKRLRIFNDKSLEIGNVEAVMERLQRREAEKGGKGEDSHENDDAAKNGDGQHVGVVPVAEEAATTNHGQEEAFVLLDD